jgi:prepilin-type N-terminal cleavage/methylation domain-containing protein
VNSVKKPLRKSGFTILELLVAMAVMAGLLVVLLGVVDGATKLWRENESRADAYREARAALGIIARDFQNLVPTTNAGHFLINADAFPLLAPVVGIVANTNSGSAVFFLASLPTKAQDPASNRSEVCQTGCFLAFGKSSSASNSPVNTMNLYRYILSSDPTFHRLTNASQPLFPGDLATTGDPRVELLAHNISGIALRAYTANSNALEPFISSPATPLPDIVEISLSAINQEAAKKLGANAAAWTDTNSPAITSALQTFTTRIKINRQQ